MTALLDASFRIVGHTGERSVPWHDFFVTALTNCLEPEEILGEARLPPPRHGVALVGADALVDLDVAGQLSAARLVLAGIGETAWRWPEIEASLLE